MRLTPEQVRLLVAQERDRQDLARYRLNMIPTERVRAFLEHELARTPGLNRAEVAHYLDMKQIDLDRQLGYEPDRNGRRQRKVRDRGREQVGDRARPRPTRARRLLRPALGRLGGAGGRLSPTGEPQVRPIATPLMHALGTLGGFKSGPASLPLATRRASAALAVQPRSSPNAGLAQWRAPSPICIGNVGATWLRRAGSRAAAFGARAHCCLTPGAVISPRLPLRWQNRSLSETALLATKRKRSPIAPPSVRLPRRQLAPRRHGVALIGQTAFASTAAGRGPRLRLPLSEGRRKTSPSRRW